MQYDCLDKQGQGEVAPSSEAGPAAPLAPGGQGSGTHEILQAFWVLSAKTWDIATRVVPLDEEPAIVCEELGGRRGALVPLALDDRHRGHGASRLLDDISQPRCY